MVTQNASPPIAPTFVNEILECGLRAEVDIPDLLAHLNLRYDDLDSLSVEAFGALWLEMSLRIGDEFFRLGQRPMTPGSFTLMGHAVRDAGKFDVALHRALRFLNVVIGEPNAVVETHGTNCIVRLVETEGPRSAFAYRTYFLILHGLTCWLVRERIPLQSIRFPCLEPSAKNDYGDFFGLPVRFGAPDAAISFDAKYLRRPVRRTEQELKVFLRTTPGSLLRGYRPVLSLKRRIQDLCLNVSFDEWPSTKQIAESLGTSKSTLHRRLADEGQSIRSIKEEKRRSQAAYLLKYTQHPISEIARSVGYAETSAFHRAFRRWYSSTPAQMRRGQ
ncbi:AraC family transcriptional regulator [Sulfitobacter sp. NFXS29]|uniref:AraC family transcriptional regulator n=1 Tax=Sulfitobacter sp. NFXS29 TaxID=2818438 RepID=UPI0032E04639